MTDPYEYKHPDTAVPAVNDARCRHCSTADDLVYGDGDRIVCRSCIRVLGGIVADPSTTRQTILDELLDRHGDVVRLLHTTSGRYVWRWTDRWPFTEGR